jgi:hypothetical protein
VYHNRAYHGPVPRFDGGRPGRDPYPGIGNTPATYTKFAKTSLPPALQEQLASAVTDQQKYAADSKAVAAIEKMLHTKGLLSAAARVEAEKVLASLEGEMLTIKKRQAAALLQQKQAAAQAATTFQASSSLQVAMARADALAAFGGGTTEQQIKLAKELKAAAMKAIDSHTKTFEGLIAAWNAVGQANSVLAQSQGLVNTYHTVSSRAIVGAVEGLTRTQRIELEARISQAAAHRGYVPNGPAIDGQVIDVTIHSDIDQTVSKIDKHHRRTFSRAGARR